MLYFPNERKEERADPTSWAAVAALVELLPGVGNQFEPRSKIARSLHRVPPSGIYHDGVDCFSDRQYQPDHWHHLVMVADTDEMRLYMNGQIVARQPIVGKIGEAPLVSIGRFKRIHLPGSSRFGPGNGGTNRRSGALRPVSRRRSDPVALPLGHEIGCFGRAKHHGRWFEKTSGHVKFDRTVFFVAQPLGPIGIRPSRKARSTPSARLVSTTVAITFGV